MKLPLAIPALCVSLLCLGGSAARSQEVSDSNPNQTRKFLYPALSRPRRKWPSAPANNSCPRGHSRRYRSRSQASSSCSGLIARYRSFPLQPGCRSLPSPGCFVTDVSYSGGPVITDAINYPAYVNTTPAAVGYPGALLHDLGKSDMVHVIDQYLGLTASNRYKADDLPQRALRAAP